MFLDHKYLYYDVDPFLFYIICEHDDQVQPPVHAHLTYTPLSPTYAHLTCTHLTPAYAHLRYTLSQPHTHTSHRSFR
jgi:hypothetical protein